MSQLLSTPTRRPLIIYHFMYGKNQTLPCPMCTMLIDGFNGIAIGVEREYAYQPRS